MRVSSLLAAAVTAACALVGLASGCETKEPQSSSYFQTQIAPVLQTSCAHTNTGAGCHVADDKGYSLGNLDVTTYANFNRRRDLLLDYGPYGQPAFLLKNVPPTQIQIQAYDGKKVTVMTDIRHAGGPILDPTASAYQVLRRYIENGATENNTGAPPANIQRSACSNDVPQRAGFDPNVRPAGADFDSFTTNVNPILGGTCGAGNCHGSPANDLYLTCGNNDQEIRWNYFAATEYLAQTPEQSEIVRRPLAPSQGGSFHEGGTIFASSNDSGYQAILQWAKDHGPPMLGNVDAGFDFFAHKVQPILAKKGCMMVQCHSPAMFHDYRLRGGSGGSFSLSATRRNYNLSVAQMSLESENANASRLVRKNLYRPEAFDGSPGLIHRGGSLLEDFGNTLPTNATCDDAMPAYDYDNGDLDKIPAYCVVREWLRRERMVRNLAPLSAIVYVRRPISGNDRAQDFDVFAGGAELHLAKATIAPTGDVTVTADDKVDLSACGLGGSPDVKRPAVSWDGRRIAFAARATEADPLQIYVMSADGTGCMKEPTINAGASSGNGLLVHNFDPAFGPSDASGKDRIVFASTRGNTDGAENFDYSGPQRTPADPTKPNANLYVLEPDPNNAAASRVRQITYQLNTERYPTFMQDGRIIFTTEKREPGFYQLALRRINPDGTDYHPLYAQRSSIGYHQATYPIELAHKDFAAIFSEPGAPHGGGALAVFNRSIGVDFSSSDPKDYLADPAVLDPASDSSVESSFFLHSLRFPDPGASGKPGATTGLYTSPSILPEARVLVSWGAASDVASFNGDYDVYVLDPTTGQKTKIAGAAGMADVEAVAVFARAEKGLFSATFDEPNGVTHRLEGHGETDLLVLDMNVLATLLFQNTPTKKAFDPGIGSFEVYEEMPPPPEVTSFGAGGANVAKDDFGQVYVKRRLLGQVPLAGDGSAHVTLPGGVPLVLHLPDTDMSRADPAHFSRWQREEMSFLPGEYVHQSFRRDFFNGLCGQCHGSISGRPLDVAVQPDVLTQASQVASRDAPPTSLNQPPGNRGQPEGPPATP